MDFSCPKPHSCATSLAHFPQELLIHIFAQLEDHLHLKLVCRNWREATYAFIPKPALLHNVYAFIDSERKKADGALAGREINSGLITGITKKFADAERAQRKERFIQMFRRAETEMQVVQMFMYVTPISPHFNDMRNEIESSHFDYGEVQALLFNVVWDRGEYSLARFMYEGTNEWCGYSALVRIRAHFSAEDPLCAKLPKFYHASSLTPDVTPLLKSQYNIPHIAEMVRIADRNLITNEVLEELRVYADPEPISGEEITLHHSYAEYYAHEGVFLISAFPQVFESKLPEVLRFAHIFKCVRHLTAVATDKEHANVYFPPELVYLYLIDELIDYTFAVAEVLRLNDERNDEAKLALLFWLNVRRLGDDVGKLETYKVENVLKILQREGLLTAGFISRAKNTSPREISFGVMEDLTYDEGSGWAVILRQLLRGTRGLSEIGLVFDMSQENSMRLGLPLLRRY